MEQEKTAGKNWFYRVFRFYVDGFKNMTTGKTLWLIIGIKLFIMFFVLKLFFFPNYLAQKGASPEQKADFVSQELIDRKQ